MVQASKLNGLNPLSYLGVNPESPVPLFIRQRSPTINDYQNFAIGTVWIVTGQMVTTEEIWQLVSLSEGIATWVQLYPGGGGSGASTFNADSGAANEAGGAISILGGTNCSTTGAGDTLTINLDADIPDEFQTDSGVAAPSAGVLRIIGGDNIITSAAGNTITVETTSNVSITGSLDVATTTDLVGALTANSAATFGDTVTISDFGRGVLQSNAVGLISSSTGTNGQVLIGSTGLSPAWSNITSTDGSVTVTNGAGSINLSATGGMLGSAAFYASPPSSLNISQSNYDMGSLLALDIKIDTAGAFYAGDGVGTPASFTAPATGIYFLSFNVYTLRFAHPSFNQITARIITPARRYDNPSDSNGSNFNALQVVCSCITQLTMGDVVTFQLNGPQPGTYSLVGDGGAGTTSDTSVFGYRIA